MYSIEIVLFMKSLLKKALSQLYSTNQTYFIIFLLPLFTFTSRNNTKLFAGRININETGKEKVKIFKYMYVCILYLCICLTEVAVGSQFPVDI